MGEPTTDEVSINNYQTEFGPNRSVAALLREAADWIERERCYVYSLDLDAEGTFDHGHFLTVYHHGQNTGG